MKTVFWQLNVIFLLSREPEEADSFRSSCWDPHGLIQMSAVDWTQYAKVVEYYSIPGIRFERSDIW